MLQADIDHLNSLATQLGTIADQVQSIPVNGSDQEVSTAMPGSQVPQSMVAAGAEVAGAFLQTAARMRNVRDAITDSASSLQNSDDQLATRLHGFDFHPAGGK